jgi:hypothetical protein
MQKQWQVELDRVAELDAMQHKIAALRENAAEREADRTAGVPRLPVNMADVFPQGCYLVLGSISEAHDHAEEAETGRPPIDNITSKRVYQCRVVYMDPDPRGRLRETVVKIMADQLPVLPAGKTGDPYESVGFEGLTAIPYSIDRDRTAYASLRATGIRFPS